SWGGGEKWCVEAASALRMRGHRVAIACAEGSALQERAVAEKLDAWPLPLGVWRAPRAALLLARRLREERIELVVANVGRDVRLGAFACARSGAKLLQRRGIARPLKRDPLNRWIYRRCVRRVIANCAAIRDAMLAEGDVLDARRFVVIPNGVEVAAPADGARWRAEHGIAPDAPLAIAVGRLAPMKGHADLLRAWKRVSERVPRAVLAILGDGESRAELASLHAQLALGDSVHFVGFVRELSGAYAAAHALVLPSVRDEGCNNALLEAMARGLPAVVTRCGGLPECVVEGQTGHVVPIGDERALADALARLLAEPEQRALLGARARELAREKFSVARVTTQLEELLREVRDER
ncbi:MAG TPA: glycosyltransferase family 4 protein, partial [Planctomycetota bacterium]|nr:glycosyltransferase family 4 protein [Planctomycetota bacterium]